jgi:hypothetical protein
MVGVWYRRMLLSMPCLLLSRIASTAAAALDVGGLEMGVVVGNRLVGLLVELEVVVVELEVVAPVDVAPVAPVVVWLEVVPVVVVA